MYSMAGSVNSVQKQNVHVPLPCSTYCIGQEINVDYTMNSEMKKLEFVGAGHKVAMPSIKEGENPESLFVYRMLYLGLLIN